jgi:hypothetical protein
MIFTTDEIKPKSIRKFGLNKGNITKIEWVNDPIEALKVEFLVEGDTTPIFYTVFPINKLFDKNSNELGVDTPEYTAAYKKAESDLAGLLVHVFKPFVSIEKIKETIGTKDVGFNEFVKILISILPKNYTTISIDIFLQYQWNLKDGKEVTFLEVPKSIKHGAFVTTHQVGEWNKIDGETLRYVDATNNVHPFTRSDWFMKSNFAKQQKSAFSETSESPIVPTTNVIW